VKERKGLLFEEMFLRLSFISLPVFVASWCESSQTNTGGTEKEAMTTLGRGDFGQESGRL